MIRRAAHPRPGRNRVRALVLAAGLISCGGEGSRASTSVTATAGTDGPTSRPESCEEASPRRDQGLVFDGHGAVAMGLAPALGLDEFTLEAWVRRDGRGREVGTGAGGIRLVPIITRGRGERDGSNLDCNYAFGFVGEVLAADFEDLASGANHPIQGKTPIPIGQWHHVAATYDGARWRLYVDGVLDAEALVGAVPRHDSIQHFGLGTALNSRGVAAGGLHGALDEVRVYGRALAAEELQATMNSTRPDRRGLVAHYPLDVDVRGDAVAPDLVGSAPGKLRGGVVAGPGAALDRGAAPVFGPARSSDAGATWTLGVEVRDPDGDAVEVEFFARQLTEADEFTIVVLPDTQYYTRDAKPPRRPEPDDIEYFAAQTRWAWEHRHSRRVVGVFGVGDIVNDADEPAQWARASAAMAILEDPNDAAFPDGLPYAVAFGNHDQYPRDTADSTTAANEHFGVARFAGRGYYGGNFDGDNDANYVYFTAGDLQIVVLSLQFAREPDPAVLAWARGVFAAHPRALGVVSSHFILTDDGEFSRQGAEIYAALRDVPNVQLMASGHVKQDARRTDDFAGNVIHSMLSDFQRSAPDPKNPQRPRAGRYLRTNGGDGYMRIWTFSPAQQRLRVETYSPRRDASYTDDRNLFTLDVDLVGAGGPFTSLGVAAAREGAAEIVLPATVPGQRFEWYAVARDCVHTTTLELQSLAVPAR